MITEEQLISKLQKLNNVKPNQDWVILTKREILGQKKPIYTNNFKFQTSNFKFTWAYAFATLLLVILGTVGFGRLTMPGDMIANVQRNVQRIVVVNEAKQSAARVVKALRSGLPKDSQAAKELASEIEKIKQYKTLADIVSIEEIKDLNNELEIVVKNEILSLEKSTLTEEQQESLIKIKALYEAKDYSTALEEILTIGK